MQLVLRRCVSIVVLLATVACNRGAGDRRADTPRAAVPGTYTAAEFQHLRWLDGRWKGRMQDDKNFYEQYRFVDDSTIKMYTFSDSTFTQTVDSARVLLREGTVANEGTTARWVAERLDTLGVEFAPDSGATNYFVWSKDSPNSWTATLRWIDGEGKSQRLEYALQRLKP